MQKIPTTPSVTSTPLNLVRVLAQENAQLYTEVCDLRERVALLTHNVSWFQNQLFGIKSEKLHTSFPVQDGVQQLALSLGSEAQSTNPTPPQATTITAVPAHKRRGKAPKKDIADGAGVSGLRFNSTVEVQEVDCPNAVTEGLSPDEYEILGYEVVDKLCERKTSYYVKRFKRAKVKLKESGAIITAPTPPSVLPGSFMDVSFLSCMIIAKILFHLPLYRTHQRLLDGCITVARSTLTNGFHAAGDLLQPVLDALLRSVKSSAVLTMDETPVKIGVDSAKHKMHQAYFWALYGDNHEVAFLSYDNRRHNTLSEILGDQFHGVLLSDDYGAYKKYAERLESVIQALCWSHTRRNFYDAKVVEPVAVDTTLALFGGLYRVEQEISDKQLDGAQKLAYRTMHAAPKVDELFKWMKEQSSQTRLLPKSPYRKALAYAISNEKGLREFLFNPDIPLDTNHIERANKSVAIGKKNWLFCQSEIGGEYVALFHSLLFTARLHNVDPYDYLTDVLMRVRTTPDADLYSLTPRGWKMARINNSTDDSATTVA